MLFNHHEEDNHGNGCKQGSCKQILPLDHVEGRELGNADGDRAVGCRGNQHGGDGVFIPCIDENEDQRRHDAGSRHWQKHPQKGLHGVAAVNFSRLLHLG